MTQMRSDVMKGKNTDSSSGTDHHDCTGTPGNALPTRLTMAAALVLSLACGGSLTGCGDGAGTPRLSVATPTFTMGTVTLSDTGRARVRLTNTGTAALVIESVEPG